ncbi:hypothetical protein ABBQ32_012121 [Trebouxia sp. C0010 RCD-2024]
MDAHNLRIRQQHRDLLRATDFTFCDDSEQEPDITLKQAAKDLATSYRTGPLQHVLCEGVTASSCDHGVHQNIGNTLSDDDAFWSSTGSGPQQEEYLLYRLASPHSYVYAVQIAIYRARYQLGAPMYPPKSISFETGFSQNHMQPVPGHYQAQLTDHVQTFKLPASSAGQFLKVIMHGKVQQQLEDRQYFTAIRCVKAIGRCLPAAAVHEASQLIRSGQLPLSQSFNMPVSVCLQLLNTTVHCRYSYAAYYSTLTGCNCPFCSLSGACLSLNRC